MVAVAPMYLHVEECCRNTLCEISCFVRPLRISCGNNSVCKLSLVYRNKRGEDSPRVS